MLEKWKKEWNFYLSKTNLENLEKNYGKMISFRIIYLKKNPRNFHSEGSNFVLGYVSRVVLEMVPYYMSIPPIII